MFPNYPNGKEWAEAWEAKLAAEQQASQDAHKSYVGRLLKSGTYSEVESLWKNGSITYLEWCDYCYRFRDAAFKYSDLGRGYASEHSKRNGLPLPYSDRAI